MKDITKFAIFPAIGIARVGNSPEFFFTSEVAGKGPTPSDGNYKDQHGRVKKQVPLFRIYGLDENDKVISEVTADDCDKIEWTVHVANRKACWYQFNNALDLGEYSIPALKRNGNVTIDDRSRLVIDPGPISVSGRNISGDMFAFRSGKFYDKTVPLGELRTDDKGRLMFFGGEGSSASPDGSQAITFANNDGWHDDVSDGPVRAQITYRGKTFEAAPSFVVCAPPNFAPGIFPVVSMHDVVFDLYVSNGWMPFPQPVDFWQHIYPILSRLSQVQWVNHGFFMLFGKNSPSDFSDKKYLAQLSDPASASMSGRMRVLDFFRDPNAPAPTPEKLPPYYGDLFGDFVDLSKVDLSLTATQYKLLEKWSKGDFETGAPPVFIEFNDMTPEMQTGNLLRAPLEECLGGPFHPGIEITWPFRHMMMWDKPWRLKISDVKDDYGPMLTSEIALSAQGPLDGSGPGSLTRWLGVPWQTDEASCLSGYDTALYLPMPSFWAARVPNQVLTEDSFMRIVSRVNVGQKMKHFSFRPDWLRDFGSAYVPKINAMIARWHELGIISLRDSNVSDEFLETSYWVEMERKGPEKGKDASWLQVLLVEETQEMEKRDMITFKALAKEGRKNVQTRETRPFKRNER